MNVTDIANAFTNGDLARTNLFEVEIPFLGKNMKFKCKAATMPASNMDPVIVGYQNKKYKLAGDRTYDDWVITVYNDADHESRSRFLDWSHLAHNLGKSIYGETPNTYKKTAIVRQFDRQEKITKEYTIMNCWPSIVGEVSLDWDENNTVEVFQVTLVMDWWEDN